jgi:diguanylate cyclase (GGDEF)-like protein
MDQFVHRVQDKYYRNSEGDTQFSVKLLSYVQMSLIVFLVITLVVVITLTPAGNRSVYLFITGSMLALLGLSVWLGVTGRYRLSCWMTVLLMFIGPWASVLYEHFQFSGDYIPMLYLIIPIQIAALFVSIKFVQGIAAFQVIALTVLVLTDPRHASYNWPSIICFILVASMLGAITNFVLRRQYESLIRSRNDLARSESQMRDISVHDPLTGLFNRRYMDDAFARQFDSPSPHFSLLMVDVDHLKEINDSCGHSCGDDMIRKVADILTASIRKHDVACRYGGDEFLLILSECDLDSALVKAQKIKAEGESLVMEKSSGIPETMTVSIGVAQCPQNGTDQDAILKAVDAALYMAKQNGRNRVDAADGLFASALTVHTS